MKRISYWASSHARTARAFITIIHIALLLLVYFLGTTLHSIGVTLPKDIFYSAGIALMIIAALIYPRKVVKRQYWKQKICDFTIPFCACSILIATINNADNQFLASAAYGSNPSGGPLATEIAVKGEPRNSTRYPQENFKKKVVKQLKKVISSKLNKDPGKSTRTKKTLLIILAVIVMLGLLGLLAALVCTIACGSGWAGAVAVGAVGLAAIIWAFVAIVKRISQGPKKRQAKKEQ